jgi:hypothetical protein
VSGKPPNVGLDKAAKGADEVAAIGGLAVRVHRGLPDEHEFYATVGRVASEAAHLEHMLDLIIWEFFGAEQVKAACVTSQLFGPAPRFQAIISLCINSGLAEATVKQARKLLESSRGATDGRNRIVHDAWYVEDRSGGIAQFRVLPRQNPKQFGTVDTDMDEVKRTLDSLRKWRIAIGDFRSDIMTELSQLKEKGRA